MRPSLARRLLALVTGLVALAWLAVAATAWLQARHEAEELLDAHLAQSAALLLAQGGELDTERAAPLHRLARRTAFQVWHRGVKLRAHSANAPAVPLSSVREGFSDAVHGGEAWRVFGAWDDEHENLVQVAERRSARRAITSAFGAALLWPLAGALPLLAAAIWLAVRAGLRPLAELRRQLGRRSPSDLGGLDASRAPREVAPLIEELNALFSRIAEAMRRERRLTADAAHELRTPLAVLSTQAQVARGASSASVRDEALDSLVAGAERAARLVEQMLTLARVESGESVGRPARVELRGVAREALAQVAPLAVAKGIDVALEDGPPVEIEGHAALLAVLARNLVDNAVRYTQSGGEVRVAVAPVKDGARVEVRDNGPGVPPEELSRLGERFHRLESDASGSGLGLSIVQRIAALCGGEVRYAAGPGGRGLEVAVQLPARPGA